MSGSSRAEPQETSFRSGARSTPRRARTTSAAGLEDCEVETKVSKSYKGYRFKKDDPVVRIAAAALERSGYKPVYGLSGGAADANIFNEHGLACLNLANGMQDIHTPDERITVADLDGMVEVTLALVAAARDADA